MKVLRYSTRLRLLFRAVFRIEMGFEKVIKYGKRWWYILQDFAEEFALLVIESLKVLIALCFVPIRLFVCPFFWAKQKGINWRKTYNFATGKKP